MASLHFTELHIRRAPGCVGGWSLRELSPGINIIAGPNASGKTTTARAITSILWPSTAPAQGESAARFNVAGETWDCEIYGTHAKFQRNGQPAERPNVPSAETMRNRCYIALPDLLVADDDEIGKAILREAVGNFDVEGAASALRFSDNPRLQRGLREKFAATQLESRRIAGSFDALTRESERLADLGAAVEKAKAARDRAALLTQAIEKRADAIAHAEAAKTLAAFDPRLNFLTGHELAQIEEKRHDLTGLQDAQEIVRRAIEKSNETEASCRLPEGGVPAAVLSELRTRIENLRTVDATLERLHGTLCAARARLAEARQLFGEAGDFDVPDLPALNEIAGFVREWNDLLTDRAAAQRWREWLGAPQVQADVQALREAELFLAIWLKSSAANVVEPSWKRVALLIVAGLIALGSVWLALANTPVVWLGLIPAAFLVFVACYRPAQAASGTDSFPISRIAPPREWTPMAVQERIEEIRRQLAEESMSSERHRHFEATEPEWQRISEREAAAEGKRLELLSKFGCAIDPYLFATLVDQIGEFRRARAEATECSAQIASLEAARTDELAAIGKALAPFAAAPPRDLTASLACLEDLDQRDQQWRAARQEIEAREREGQQLASQGERIGREMAAILTAAQVQTTGDLAPLIGLIDNFREARDREKSLRGLRESAAQFFRLHADLETQTIDELEAGRNDARALGELFEDLFGEKKDIEKEIELAKRRTELQDAMTECERARRSLVDDRDEKLSALAGHCVVENLRAQLGEMAMPPVFDRARALFARFTSHAWELAPPDDSGQFRARNTALGGTGIPLNNLSSGTRVQLLLAVRAAFVAEQESGFQLPLLLDETLANSDDQRAQQIMDAVAELAREGRQIFYFTAQVDEVAKWREFFTRHPDVGCRVSDLSSARGQVTMADFDRVAPPPTILAPSPGNRSMDEYARLIGAPPFDPRGTIGATHLCHLCEDTQTLHRLLTMGFDRWGQIEDLLRHDGAKLAAENSAQLAANARLLEELGRCWQHGRGRPLVREALSEGGITENFIERAWDLACNLGRDAQRLLEAMGRGEIPRLRGASIEKFREYCEEHGYVSRETPLESPIIRARLQALALEVGVSPVRVESLLSTVMETKPATSPDGP